MIVGVWARFFDLPGGELLHIHEDKKYMYKKTTTRNKVAYSVLPHTAFNVGMRRPTDMALHSSSATLKKPKM